MRALAVEALPGQFDVRAASCEECVQLVSRGERPTVRTAKLYLLEGNLTADDLLKIKKYVINPVESREADLAEKKTLRQRYDAPADVEMLAGLYRDGRRADRRVREATTGWRWTRTIWSSARIISRPSAATRR